MKLPVGIVGLLASSIALAGAQPSANSWSDVRPSISVSVKPDSQPHRYWVTATVTDIRSGQLLYSPQILIAAEKPEGNIEIGSDTATAIRLSVKLAADESNIAYKSELFEKTELMSSQSALIALK